MTKKNILNVGKLLLVLLLVTAIISASASIFAKTKDNSDNIDSNIAISKPQYTASPLAGKYISFLGDSITTYEGWSNSTAFNSSIGQNAVYYNSATGLSVNDTWWKQLIDTNGMRLCVNNSWSAARLSSRTDPLIPSAYERYPNLNNNKGISPDIIMIYLGTNDVATSGVASSVTVDGVLSNYDAGFECLVDIPVYSLVYTVLEILESYEADVFLCTLLPESRDENSKEFLDYLNEQIRYFDGYQNRVHVVDLYEDTGITFDNYQDYYIDDGNMRVHPNAVGMDLITKCVQNKFKEVYDF